MSAAYWKPVLQAFATAPEPISWALPGLKVGRADKYEALLYLLERGLIVQSGRERREWNDSMYSVTAEGRFVYSAILHSINPRDGVVKHGATTAAQRAVASGPVDVFDLVRMPWVWDKASEQRADFVEDKLEDLL